MCIDATAHKNGDRPYDLDFLFLVRTSALDPDSSRFCPALGFDSSRFYPALISTDSAPAEGTNDPPNILMIMSDDVGWFNVSAYNNGIMGYSTPNIDSIAEDGILFTDAYAENSCTAGRSAFVTGQSPGRTGLTKVGLPGFDLGLRDEDITLAEVLKEEGYATYQFGKTTWGILMSSFPPIMDLSNSSATFTISMQKKNPKILTILTIRISLSNLVEGCAPFL